MKTGSEQNESDEKGNRKMTVWGYTPGCPEGGPLGSCRHARLKKVVLCFAGLFITF